MSERPTVVPDMERRVERDHKRLCMLARKPGHACLQPHCRRGNRVFTLEGGRRNLCGSGTRKRVGVKKKLE